MRHPKRFPPRLCPACQLMHPPLTTCQGGWRPADRYDEPTDEQKQEARLGNETRRA